MHTCRERDAEAREGMLAEQEAEVGRREEAALALKQRQLRDQQELERGRGRLAEQRAVLEAAQAQVRCRPSRCPPRTGPATAQPVVCLQVQREQAAAKQERALLTEQRSRREAEQEALTARLASERAAAAEQQSSVERAVDKARGAEIEAVKNLADLKAQVRLLLGVVQES